MLEKTVLFNGKNLAAFERRDGGEPTWNVCAGAVTVAPRSSDLVTKEKFGDAHFHVEFRCPEMPGRTGQGRGNSGVYVQGCIEIQVLDSFGNEPPTDGDCAAVYSICPPLQNASLEPDSWQTYDIIFRAARFDADGKITELPRLTLLQNGICVHNNLELPHPTPGGITDRFPAEGPLLLQDHGDPVSFRNIWAVRL